VSSRCPHSLVGPVCRPIIEISKSACRHALQTSALPMPDEPTPERPARPLAPDGKQWYGNRNPKGHVFWSTVSTKSAVQLALAVRRPMMPAAGLHVDPNLYALLLGFLQYRAVTPYR